jgi:nucleotide-binding universal stress UspA family protein
MKVVIAVDDRSHEAARVAKELFPQADHIIVSATDSDQLMVAEPIGGGIISTGYSAETLIAAESAAEDAVQKAQTIIGPDASTRVEIGDAGVVICEQSAQEGADVIVVGRRSHSWLSHLFDPSVSDYVIRHAQCPVLVVKEQGDVNDA